MLRHSNPCTFEDEDENEDEDDKTCFNPAKVP
jgi:hypothetical protein